MKWFPIIFLISFPLILSAQATDQVNSKERIDSDRPDQTDGTSTVRPGELQIEWDGYYNSFENEESALISSALLRLGVIRSAELRIVVEEGRQRDFFIDETTQGVFPLAAGTKVELIKNHWWLPDISVIGVIQIPATTKSSENPMQWAPFLTIAYEKKFDRLCVDINTGVKQAAFKIGYSWQATTSQVRNQ